jgi:hypothetical protein
LVSLILLIIAAAGFLPVFIKFLRTGLVTKMPTLIVSGFTMLCAILSFMCGLILDTVSKKAQQDFELKLNIISMLKQIKDKVI